MPHLEWIRDDRGNALSDLNLSAVESAFQDGGAVVFGFHYHYHDGAARSMVIFGSAGDLISHVTNAHPGDHFTLFDLDAVAPVAIVHLGTPTSAQALPLSESARSDLDHVARHSWWRATILVQRSTSDAGSVNRCSIEEREPADFTTNWEDYREYAVRAAWPPGEEPMSLDQRTGELFAFDESDLDRDAEAGGTIVTVTATGGRRTHALVDAKRPDEQGRVPVSAAD